MILQEAIANYFVLLPDNWAGSHASGNLIGEFYRTDVADPWTHRKVGLAVSFVGIALLLTFLKMNREARTYAFFWSVYFAAQVLQYPFTGNIQALEWHVDALLLGVLMGMAALFNWKRDQINRAMEPILKVVWRR
jgi:predicted membrane-bound mannosyltransferase